MRELEGWLDSKWSNDRHQVIESGKFMFFFWGGFTFEWKSWTCMSGCYQAGDEFSI